MTSIWDVFLSNEKRFETFIEAFYRRPLFKTNSVKKRRDFLTKTLVETINYAHRSPSWKKKVLLRPFKGIQIPLLISFKNGSPSQSSIEKKTSKTTFGYFLLKKSSIEGFFWRKSQLSYSINKAIEIEIIHWDSFHFKRCFMEENLHWDLFFTLLSSLFRMSSIEVFCRREP